MPRIPIAKTGSPSEAQVVPMTTQPPQAPQAPSINKFLHYGGSLNRKTGRLGPKPQAGRQFKVQKRLELICRLENAMVSEVQTAAMLGISVPRLRTIKKTPDYLNTRIRITTGVIVDIDGHIENFKSQRRDILAQAVPPAIQILVNELNRQPINFADRKLQTEIARDLLDREGTLAKVSKTEIKPVSNFDFEQHDKESSEIIKALRAVSPRRQSLPFGEEIEAATLHSEDAVDANAEFARSHTLSAIDQQAALDALEAEAAEANLLELIPSPSSRIN